MATTRLKSPGATNLYPNTGKPYKTPISSQWSCCQVQTWHRVPCCIQPSPTPVRRGHAAYGHGHFTEQMARRHRDNGESWK